LVRICGKFGFLILGRSGYLILQVCLFFFSFLELVIFRYDL